MTRVRVLLLGFLSASCDVSTIELLADLADGGSVPDASGGLLPSGDGSPGVGTPECTESYQCVGALRHCDPAKQYCVECLDDLNCADDQRCNESSGQCLSVCAADGDCAGDAGSLCDTTRGFCVECDDDSQCNVNEVCNRNTGTCMAVEPL